MLNVELLKIISFSLFFYSKDQIHLCQSDKDRSGSGLKKSKKVKNLEKFRKF